MHPSKAPGPDGMSPFFFQKYWDLVGLDVSNAVIHFLTTKEVPLVLNFTHVVLIPKVKEPQDISHLRPIALCNVIYKIASKVLANRLKVFLPTIIAPEQSAFVPNRLISDNTLVASELAHFMHNLRRGKEGFMALKLDISKAYDRLEWHFLQRILQKLGFDDDWIELIMTCLSTVRYSFLINGEPRGYVAPSRGLRQGDPLSPYLFILCAEGLSALISHFVSIGSLQGLKVCDGAPVISHLLFADDSMIYSQATMQDCLILKHILDVYARASGQQINLQKSNVVFSGSVPTHLRQSLAQLLGVEQVSHHEKYLGLPTYVGRFKSDAFAFLKDRLAKKLTGWRSKLLSSAGREVLIKVVAQAMPLYTMSCYLLPQQLCQELHQLCAQFWWGSKEDKRAMHWRAWDALCKPKSMGGMGFRHLFAFNLAMLAKQGWRFIQNPNSLVSRLFKAIYFPHSSFWNADIGHTPSYAWRSILHGRDVLNAGIRRHIGDGRTTNIWTEPWLPGEDLSSYFNLGVLLVSELLSAPGTWNIPLLSELFPSAIVNKILSIPLSVNSHADRWIWGADKRGIFSVKSAYHVARAQVLNECSSSPNPSTNLWNGIWSAQVPGKVKICAWKACANILPTRGRLSERGIDIDTQCPLCDEEVETPMHVLRDCTIASEVLSIAPLALVTSATIHSCVHSWLLDQLRHLSKSSFSLLLMLLWAIWRNRNSTVWDEVSKSASDIVPVTMGWWEEFRSVHTSSNVPQQPRLHKWKPPPLGLVKLNVDASFNLISGGAGLGGVFRDSQGTVLGVQEACKRHMVPLLVESDCLSIVQALQSAVLDFSELGFLLEDLRQMLSEASAASLSHIYRSANAVAHLLAREAGVNHRSFEFFSVAPSFLEAALSHNA
ncbi:hypothetical protein M0R45_026537 [Rubus argutus]|uniref:Reverse transcriptase domain-containing protein n=1 Tax=Rubus argutus TaxID=59490 RepID=A0AAW1WXQ0_RUBAR